MKTEVRDLLEYVLNRLERAEQSSAPAANGYGDARRELLDRIVALRVAAENLKVDNDELRADINDGKNCALSLLAACKRIRPAGLHLAGEEFMALQDWVNSVKRRKESCL
jgi:hypothetical protein